MSSSAKNVSPSNDQNSATPKSKANTINFSDNPEWNKNRLHYPRAEDCIPRNQFGQIFDSQPLLKFQKIMSLASLDSEEDERMGVEGNLGPVKSLNQHNRNITVSNGRSVSSWLPGSEQQQPWQMQGPRPAATVFACAASSGFSPQMLSTSPAFSSSDWQPPHFVAASPFTNTMTPSRSAYFNKGSSVTTAPTSTTTPMAMTKMAMAGKARERTDGFLSLASDSSSISKLDKDSLLCDLQLRSS
eukprot:TRINITY_DN1568_c0_g1_i2.p1 TRINITY_DN1568_c0_g1~~TRINITY_DN1568_c0_g1_i2.p1  ORF type:complete len:244 (-),score=34.71 TRINITY_DN1568_c0_g1_i2:330-1061(-)